MKITITIPDLPPVPEKHPLSYHRKDTSARLSALAEMTDTKTIEGFIVMGVLAQVEMYEKDMIFSDDGRVIGDLMDICSLQMDVAKLAREMPE